MDPDHVNYEDVHFPVRVTTVVALLISLWNFPFELTVRLTICHRDLGSAAYPGFQWLFFASPAFDLKRETLASLPLDS